jgi:hypothetical protein
MGEGKYFHFYFLFHYGCGFVEFKLVNERVLKSFQIVKMEKKNGNMDGNDGIEKEMDRKSFVAKKCAQKVHIPQKLFVNRCA